jgi:hypothetical protein
LSDFDTELKHHGRERGSWHCREPQTEIWMNVFDEKIFENSFKRWHPRFINVTVLQQDPLAVFCCIVDHFCSARTLILTKRKTNAALVEALLLREVAEDRPRFRTWCHDQDDWSSCEGVFEATIKIEWRRLSEGFAEIDTDTRSERVVEQIWTEDTNNQQAEEFSDFWRRRHTLVVGKRRRRRRRTFLFLLSKTKTIPEISVKSVTVVVRERIDRTSFVFRPAFKSLVRANPSLPLFRVILNFVWKTHQRNADFRQAQEFIPSIWCRPIRPAFWRVSGKIWIFEVCALVDDGVTIRTTKEEVPFVGSDVTIGAEDVRDDEEGDELLVTLCRQFGTKRV